MALEKGYNRSVGPEDTRGMSGKYPENARGVLRQLDGADADGIQRLNSWMDGRAHRIAEQGGIEAPRDASLGEVERVFDSAAGKRLDAFADRHNPDYRQVADSGGDLQRLDYLLSELDRDIEAAIAAGYWSIGGKFFSGSLLGYIANIWKGGEMNRLLEEIKVKYERLQHALPQKTLPSAINVKSEVRWDLGAVGAAAGGIAAFFGSEAAGATLGGRIAKLRGIGIDVSTSQGMLATALGATSVGLAAVAGVMVVGGVIKKILNTRDILKAKNQLREIQSSIRMMRTGMNASNSQCRSGIRERALARANLN